MRDISLDQINLNLVPVLRALLRECSVSRAAAVLNRSPSSVSAALSQLRTALGDQLLVRVGQHLRLTSRAVALVEPLEELHDRLESFFKSERFHAGKSERQFTIAASDVLICMLGQIMVQTMRRVSPHMSLRFVDVARGLTEKMAAREIDFALLPEFAVADLAPAPMKFTPLCQDGTKALMSSDHPLATRTSLSREDLRRHRHVGFLPDSVLLDGRRSGSRRGTEVYDGGGGFDRAVTVSQFLTIPSLLAGTDLVAVVPTLVATMAVRSLPLIAVDLAYNSARPQLGLAWSPVYDQDEAHRWFRTSLATQWRSQPRSAALGSASTAQSTTTL